MPTRSVRPKDDPQASSDHPRWPNVVSKDLFREDHDITETPLWWWVLFAPGKILLWFEYMFPKRIGGVFGSARRIKSPILQVWYSLAIYFVIVVCLIAVIFGR